MAFQWQTLAFRCDSCVVNEVWMRCLCSSAHSCFQHTNVSWMQWFLAGIFPETRLSFDKKIPSKYQNLNSRYSTLIFMDRQWQLIFHTKHSRYYLVIGWLTIRLYQLTAESSKSTFMDIHYACFILPVCSFIFWTQPCWCGLWHWITV